MVFFFTHLNNWLLFPIEILRLIYNNASEEWKTPLADRDLLVVCRNVANSMLTCICSSEISFKNVPALNQTAFVPVFYLNLQSLSIVYGTDMTDEFYTPTNIGLVVVCQS